MRKSILILLIASITTLSCLSQDTAYISLSIGPSFPINTFSSKDTKGDSSAFAKIGGFTDISFSYKIRKNFGVTAMLRGQLNGTDSQAITDTLNKLVPSAEWKVNSKSWKIGGLMIGGFGTVDITKKLSCDAKLMIGLMDASSPEITTTGEGSSGKLWMKEYSSNASAFAFLAGIGLKYHIKEKYSLLFKADYLYSHPYFKDVEVNSSAAYPTFIKFDQKIETINLSLGLAITL